MEKWHYGELGAMEMLSKHRREQTEDGRRLGMVVNWTENKTVQIPHQKFGKSG